MACWVFKSEPGSYVWGDVVHAGASGSMARGVRIGLAAVALAAPLPEVGLDERRPVQAAVTMRRASARLSGLLLTTISTSWSRATRKLISRSIE